MTTADFLRAVAAGKHRIGWGKRLRSAVADSEYRRFGVLVCFCCAQPITKREATLEHITPQSAGGKSLLRNLALSHAACNAARGNSGSPRKAVVVSGRPGIYLDTGEYVPALQLNEVVA